MQGDLNALKAHARVVQELDSVQLRLRYQDNRGVRFLSLLALTTSLWFGAAVWVGGLSGVGWIALVLVLLMLGVLLVVRRPHAVPVRLTPHTITLNGQELTWDEVVDVTIAEKGDQTELVVHASTQQIRQVFWMPPAFHSALLRVLRTHLPQHRPAIATEDALPDALRTVQAAGQPQNKP